MTCRILLLILPLALILLASFASFVMAKDSTTSRETAATLSVLSGLLVALSILVPLLAASSPWSRGLGWRWWLLLGVLSAGVLGIFGTILCMIKLQPYRDFNPSEKRLVPAIIS